MDAIADAVQSAGERLGYKVRHKQLEIATEFVKGSDVFVSLPTGSSKSGFCPGFMTSGDNTPLQPVCWWLLALLLL